MEITGKLLQILPEVAGQGKNGTWSKRDIIIETQGEYAKKVCITIWGDKVNLDGIGIGQKLTAHIELSSREYGGKWFSEIKAWKVTGFYEPKSETKKEEPEYMPTGIPSPDDEQLPF